MFDDDILIGVLNDPSLQALICCRTDAERMREIGRLIVQDARAVVEQVLAHYRKMVRGVTESDLEDVAATVSLRLATKLQHVPYSVDEAIRDFDVYVARTTSNAVHDLLRTRFPLRARLERRLRYLLKWDRRLASWDSRAGVLCGLAEWEHSSAFASMAPVNASSDRVSADDLVTLFRRAGQPVRFDVLANAFAVAWGMAGEGEVESPDPLPDEGPGQLVALESKQQIQMVWEEIQQLHEGQRAALLLNLRNAGRENVLELFPVTGVASFSELAAALAMSPEQLAEVWNDLPLDDLRIAAILRLKRQQVINLRMSARKRLQRRLLKRAHPQS
jgi:hypothetical protein